MEFMKINLLFSGHLDGSELKSIISHFPCVSGRYPVNIFVTQEWVVLHIL